MGTERALSDGVVTLYRIPNVASVVLAVAAFSGCSGDRPSLVLAESAAGNVSADADSLDEPTDAQSVVTQSLLRRLADRDAALLEMARIAVTRKEPLQVSGAARAMLSDQRSETGRLLSMLKGEYRITYEPTIAAEEQTLIDSLNGTGYGQFDSTFVGIVSKFHEDDADVIQRALPVVSPKLRDALAEIRDARKDRAAALGGQLPSRKHASPR